MAENIENRIRSDRRVALGLAFVYAGLCLAVFAVIWGALVPQIILRRPDLAVHLIVFSAVGFVGMLVASIICGSVGRLLCLLVSHREVGVVFYLVIVLAVVADLTGLTVAGLQFWHLFDKNAPHIEALESFVLPLGLAGHGLFLVFLIRLALLVERPALTAMAAVAFASSAAVTSVLVYLAQLDFADAIQVKFDIEDPKVWVFGIICLVALITYGNTLSYLRRALKSRSAAPSGADESTADARVG